MNIKGLDFSRFEMEVSKASEALFSACQEACPDETIYGFALIPDEDVQSLYWTADSKNSLEKISRQLHQASLKHGGDQSLDEIRQIMQFACDEWAYSEETLDLPVEFDSDLGLDEIWSTFRSLQLTGAAYDEGFAVVRRQAFEAIAKGLNQFRTAVGVDDDFITLVSVRDSADTDQLLQLAKMCNAPQVFEMLNSVINEE